jgi:hypothetical protein
MSLRQDLGLDPSTLLIAPPIPIQRSKNEKGDRAKKGSREYDASNIGAKQLPYAENSRDEHKHDHACEGRTKREHEASKYPSQECHR